MRPLLLIIILLLNFNSFSQEIKWTTVKSSEINPTQLVSRGVVTLDNGDKTPEADLYINFNTQKIFYKNSVNNAIFSIHKEDFSSISLNEYEDGKTVKDGAFFPISLYTGTNVGEEIAASLRKKLYKKADLNFITITSVKKKGFFTRNQPRFEVNNGALDVSNKSAVSAKLLAISQERIEYLDEDGDLWDRGNYGALGHLMGQNKIVTNSDDKEKRKAARKSARILNILFDNRFFLNTTALYDFFFNEYEERFYQSLEDFRNDFIGMNLKDLLRLWGPNSEQYIIDENSVEYVWVFERKVTDKESSTIGTMNAVKKALTKSITEITGSISTSYGIDTNASITNLGGYGTVMNSYTSINKESFLNYYATNITSQFSTTKTNFSSKTKGTDIRIDDSKKIGVIVNKDLIVTDVLEKNYFQSPYYGVEIRFVRD
ncbi:MAG: hypothetical protein HOJ40_05105 [Flavobacteriaceae bacterium]|jgi:hypothetical protein|nr:hypothetical protein [Flavobacteriaceae bacterium]MBT5771650.1 hypothetical protein [Flavobacteriaceae bacterium]